MMLPTEKKSVAFGRQPLLKYVVCVQQFKIRIDQSFIIHLHLAKTKFGSILYSILFVLTGIGWHLVILRATNNSLIKTIQQ